MNVKNAGIIYKGKSLVDGQPIVVILSGKLNRSSNTKTGDMLQTNIIRQDIPPTVASKTGEDYSICKSCMHRGFVDTTLNAAHLHMEVETYILS